MDLDGREVRFDFDEAVQKLLPASGAADVVPGGKAYGAKIDPRHRTVVCRHWLQGLCQKGEKCDFLHMFDRSRMTFCKHGTKCKIKNCPLKHVDEDEKAECIFFKQGFCMHGALCRYRHLKRHADECPEIADFSLGVSPLFGAGDQQSATAAGKKRRVQAPNHFYKIIMCKHWLHTGNCPYGDDCHYAHGESELRPYPGAEEFEEKENADTTRIPDPYRGEMLPQPPAMPFADETRLAHYLVQAPDMVALVHSRERGVWSVPVALEPELNRIFHSVDSVLLYFSLPRCSALYGVARMTSPIPPPLPGVPVTPEFGVQWLRSCRLAFTLVAHLKVSPRGRSAGGSSIARCDEDTEIGSAEGQQLLYLLYRKPEWQWTFKDDSIRSTEMDVETENAKPQPTLREALFPQEWVMRADALSAQRPPHAHVHARTHSQSSALAPLLQQPVSSFVLAAIPAHIRESLERRMFGLPHSSLEQAQRSISAGTVLFMIDTSARVLLGVFQAASEVTLDMEPAAFGRQLPVQVRVNITLEAPPMRDGEPVVREIFGPRLRPGPLGHAHTRSLLEAFTALFEANTPPSHAQPPQHMPPASEGDPGGSKTYGLPRFYKVGSPFVRTVWIPIDIHTEFNVVRRLLGQGARNVKSIGEELGANVKVRVRGLGSDYKEGPDGAEAQEPLHFIVSADDPGALEAAVARVQELVRSVQREFEEFMLRRTSRRLPMPPMPAPGMMMWGPEMGPGPVFGGRRRP